MGSLILIIVDEKTKCCMHVWTAENSANQKNASVLCSTGTSIFLKFRHLFVITMLRSEKKVGHEHSFTELVEPFEHESKCLFWRQIDVLGKMLRQFNFETKKLSNVVKKVLKKVNDGFPFTDIKHTYLLIFLTA